ncbi:MAG: leucine-rich repeat protein [Bacteroidaceae bacterium]|nr:leucine-rich repeat protein [Bacteroidaceae bacterium]
MKTNQLLRRPARIAASLTAFVLTFMLAVLPMAKVYATTYSWQSEYIKADLQSVKIGNLYYDLNTKTHKAAVVLENSIFDAAELGWHNYKDLTSVDVPATVKFALPLQEEVTYDVVEIGRQAFHRNGISEKFTHLSLPSSIVYIGKYMLAGGNTQNIARWWKHGVYFENYLIDFNDSKDDLGLYVSDFYVEEGTRLIANEIIHGATIKQLYLPEGNIILSGDIFYLESNETSKLEKVELWGTNVNGYFKAAEDAVTIYNYDGEIDYSTETYNSLKKMYVTRNVARYHTTGRNAQWRDKVELFRFKVGDLYFELLNKNEAVVAYDASYASLSKEIVVPDKVTDNGHTFTVTKIDNEAFKDAAFTKVTLPSTITTVSEGTFSGCTKLAEVVFPDELTTISKQAFYGCTALKELHLNNVANIASEAFMGCTSLATLITDYKGVINAHSLAFDELNKGNITLQVASSLVDRYKQDSFWKDFTIASNRYKLEGIWYELSGKEAKVVKEKSGEGNYSELTGTITIPKDVVVNGKYYTVTSIEVGAFQYAPFEELDIRCQVTVLPEGCCFAMPNLTKVSLPETLVKIDEDAFNSCPKLKFFNELEAFRSADLPNLTAIGNSAFANSRLNTVILTGNLTTVGEYAFHNCTYVSWVDLGQNLKAIGKYAFSGCTNMSHISDYAAKPQPFTTGMLEGVKKNLIIRVPFNSLNAYKTADGWKDYKIIAEPYVYWLDEDRYLYFYLDDATMTATLAADWAAENNEENYKRLGNTTLEIPQEVEYYGTRTYTVVAIDSAALKYAPIKKVIIPNTVTVIGVSAFDRSALEEVEIPNSVTSLGVCAFYNCNKLKTAKLPDTLFKLRDMTFSGCSELESVVMPSDMKEIGEFAFVGCSKLKEINIPTNVVSFGKYAFIDCKGLSSFTIPERVTTIGERAFCNCTGLYEIYNLNGTPQTINANVFEGLTQSKITLYVPPTCKSAYDAKDVWKNFNVKEVSVMADGLCYRINPAAKTAQLTFDDIVNNYTGLSGTVTVPATITYNNVTYNVTEIGNYAFQGNKTISHLELPEGLVKIGHDCFEKMTALASINIPSTVTSIGRFATTNNLLSNDYLYNKNGLLIIDNCLIKAQTTIGMNVEVEDGTRLIAAYAFSGCKDLRHLILPNSIKDIGEYAFKNCTSLNEIDLPEGLTVIRRGTFQDSYVGGTSGFKIPDSVTEIERDAFGWGGTGCNDLHFIRIPENVRKIGSLAFWQAALQLVWLPAGIEELGDAAFADLAGLQEIHCFAPDPSTIKLGVNVFSGVNEDAKLYVPYGSKALYEAAEQWSAFTIVEMNPCIDGFYYILDKANHTATVTYEVYSDNDWYVKYTNYENLNTQSWTIPAKIAFENEVYEVKAVGDNAFKHTNVKQIIFSEGIESIGEDAMSECSYTSPEEIRLPSTLTNIGMWAFSYSTDNLKIIYNYATEPQDIKNKGVFNNELDKSKVTLYVPYGCADKYRAADEWKDFDIEEMPVCIDGVYYSLHFNTASIVAQYENDASNYADLVRDILVIPATITVEGEEYKVTSIDSRAFENCKGVQILSLPEGLEKIWDYAFLNTNFEMISLPSTLTLIVDNAFVGCDNLAIIRNFADEPLAVDRTGYPNITLQVPAGCKEAYEAANFWKDFDIQEMAVCIDGIYYAVNDDMGTAEVVNDYAENAYRDLGAEIVLPDVITIEDKTYTVTSVEPATFMDNEVLEKITLPYMMNNIGAQAFSGCTALRTVVAERIAPATIDATVFDGLSLSAITLFVHRDSKVAYRAADVWKEFGIVSIETPIMIAGQPVRADQYGQPLSGYDGVNGEVIVTANAINLGEGAQIFAANGPAIELCAEDAVNTFFISGKQNSMIYGYGNAAINLQNNMTLNLNTAYNGDEKTEGLELYIISDNEDGAITLANGSEVTLNINSTGLKSTNNTIVYATNAAIGIPPSAYCDIHAAGYVDLISATDVCPIGVFDTRMLTLHGTTMVLPYGGAVTDEGIFDAYGNECFRLRLMPETTQGGKAYPVEIGGMTVTDGNKDDVLGNGEVSYEPSTNILTLKCASVNQLFGQALHATAGLQLKVEGYTNGISTASGLTQLSYRPSVDVQGGDFVIFGDKEAELYISGMNGGVQCDETEQYRMEVKRCYVSIGTYSQFALQTDSLCVNAANLRLECYGGAPAWVSWNLTEDGGLVLQHANKTYGKVNADQLMEFECQDPLLFKVDVAADDEDHGSVTGGGWYEDGQQITLTATPKEAYKFARWDDGSIDNPRELTVDDDYTLKAVFVSKDVHMVTFIGFDGVALKYEDVYDGAAAHAPELDEREGWHFVKWDTDFSNVTSDLTVTAIYEKNVYTVTFIGFDGETVLKTEEVVYSEAATAPVAPTVEHYTFTGWDTNDYTCVVENLTVHAVYEIDKFTVTFIGLGEKTLSVQTVPYGGAAEPPVGVYEEGYTFIGWDKDFNYITGDLVVAAMYESNTKTFTLTLETEGEGKLFFGMYNAIGELQEAEADQSTYPVPEGSQFLIIAKPAEGWVFSKWSDGETKAQRAVTMTSDLTLKAIFEDLTDGIEGLQGDQKVQKILINGRIYILRDGHVYETTGLKVK